MPATQRVDAEAELLHRTGLEVLHEHIGPCDHGGEQRLVVGLGEVEDDRFLAAVEPDEIGALAAHHGVIAACEIALRPLDLDDARAGVGEPAGRHRRGHRLLERDDEEAGEREGHAFLICALRRAVRP
jgi:hypothetical protein